MQLGAFSVSLAVKDLGASRAFYEKLGFQSFAGNPAQNWLILQNGTTTIGESGPSIHEPFMRIVGGAGADSSEVTASVNESAGSLP